MSSDLSRYGAEGPAMERRHGDLADVLERVLDKGVVVAGDISISLIDIELLSIKLRLLIASAGKAREMGIDWWTHDPYLSTQARELVGDDGSGGDSDVRALNQRLDRLESVLQSARSQLDAARYAEGGRPTEGDRTGDGAERG